MPPQKNTYRRYSQAEKDEFFAVLERLECAAAAARELGFKAATCRKWVRQAGIQLKYGVKGTEPRREYTQAQKYEFFTLLDRLGNVSAAASELGLSAAACYAWVHETGALPKRARKTTGPNRKHTQAQKDEFFTVLERVGSVTEAAKQLGLSKDTCHNWAKAAGIRSVRVTVGKREEFFRLRAAGVGRREATAAVGINRKTAYLWDNGIVQAKGKLVHPETPAVDYKQTVNTAIAATEATQGAANASIAQTALEKVIAPRYLSLQDRERIRDMKAQGSSIRAVAAALGRSPSSISREISRNSHPVLGYQPYGAQRAAVARRPRPKVSKLNGNQRLRDFVKDKLLTRCSPEQISHLLIKEYPDDEQMRVSHETIYQALYLQARGGLKREVKDALRTGRTRRKPRKNPEERTSRFRDPMINISERPPEVEDRAVPGHWEGDLITGTYNQSAIATLVERTTRYVMLVHLPTDHNAESVRDGLIKTMSGLPAHLRGSLTWDQGAEMAKHKAFSIATDMDVYFCDPGSPWQRGSNENTNGLLRQYFPKGTDLSVYGPEDLEHVAQELNARPRKTLGWDTPAERLRDLLLTN